MHVLRNPPRRRRNNCSIIFSTILCAALVPGGCPMADSPIPAASDFLQDGPVVNSESVAEDEQVLDYTGIYPLTDPRGQPSNLIVTQLDNKQIRLDWQDNSADEEGFRIERQDPSGLWQSVGTVGRNQTSYIDESFEWDTSYGYRVIAFNTNNESTPSIAASLITAEENHYPSPVLLPILDLQINQIGEGSIQLSWSDVNDREKGTLLERSEDAKGWGKLAVLGPDLTTYSDTDIQAAVTYCYRATPFRANENAPASESACLILEGVTDSNQAAGGGGGGGGGTASLEPPRPPFLAVEDGRPVACIVVPPSCPSAQYNTALFLQKYLYRVTNASLPITREAASTPAIHVGRSIYVDQLPLNLENLEDEGFVLWGADENNYVITGWSTTGTELAVYEFLERYVGIRWLMPGDVGTHVPQRTRLEVPADEVRQKPAFFSRWFSGFRGDVQWEWTRRNRMQTIASILRHHNLINLLPPSCYAHTRPDFYPIINGQRYLPSNDTDYNWQPVFTAEGIVDEVARNVIDYLQAHPQVQSCSLSINDSDRYDDAFFQASPGTNFLGFANLSNPYYEFCNRVAEQVLLTGVDKYFGCLAYSHVAAPPAGFQLHPRIVPFMTYDRMKWCNPEIRDRGQKATLEWNAAADKVGWYDYLYGAVYCVPRVYPHLMQEYLRFGYANGVRAAYAEAYPFWGEGPKLYVYLRLLWDPYQDVDALLDDWYTHCVGEQAAPYLREYYAIWERFWTQEVPQLEWFKMGQQFLYFKRIEYLKGVDPADVTRSRQLLDDCVAHTQTPAQQARAEMLRRAFGYYESSCQAYRPEVIAQSETIADESTALAAVAALQTGSVANVRRFQLWNEFQTDETLQSLVSAYDPSLQGLASKTWGVSLPWRLLDQAQASQNVYLAIKNLQLPLAGNPNALPLGYPSEELFANVQNLLAFIDNSKTVCSVDSSFESCTEGQTPLLNAPWVTWPRENEAYPKFTVTSEIPAHTGANSLKIIGTRGYTASIYQTISQEDLLPPGRYLAAMRFYTPAAVLQQGEDPPPSVRISIITYANYGQSDQVQRTYSAEMAISKAIGGWNTLCWHGEIADTIDQFPVSRMWVMASAQYINNQVIYFDDIQLYKISD